MNLPSFFSKQKTAKVLLVDVGSASVGVAFALYENGLVKEIIFSERVNIPFQESLSSSRLLLGMNTALSSALKSVQKQKLGVPDKIVCTLSSPWLMVKNRSLRIVSDTPFVVTERAISDAIDKDIAELTKDLATTLPIEDVFLLEKSIIDLKVNGYHIENPYGKKTKGLDVVVTVGISSKKVVASISRIVGNIFHTQGLQFNSFPLVAFSAVRDMFPDKKEFLFVDITGETTDIMLVHEELFKEATSFSAGKNFLIRELAVAENTSHTQATSLLRMYLEERLSLKQSLSVGETVHKSKEAWLLRFEKALQKLDKTSPLPSMIFFSCDDDVANMFEELMRVARAGVSSRIGFEVAFFDQFLASRFIVFRSGIPRDPFLALEALFIQKINLV